MRRSPLALACAAALALTLAACSSTDDGGSTASDTPTTGAGETVTITGTLNGDVEVPANPERVLGLWNTGAQLHELGITPVGVLQDEYTQDGYPDDFDVLGAIPTVGTWDGLDIELIIDLEPDLIITFDNGTEWDYDALSVIAPTVAFEVTSPSAVWDNYETLATAVGKHDRYLELAEGYEADFAAVADEYGDAIADAQALYLYSYQEGSAYVYTTRALAAPRIEAVGFGYDHSWDDQTEWWGVDLDFELLDELAEADLFFYPADGSRAAENELTQALLDEPAFQQLPAVQAGHVYPYRDLFVYTFEATARQAEDLAAAAADYASGS